MSKTIKRKVRHSHRPPPGSRNYSDGRIRAKIDGEDSGELYRFGLVDVEDALPFRDQERDVYLRQD